MDRQLLWLSSLVLLALGSPAAAARNAVLVPSQDTWVSEASPGPTPGWWAQSLQVGPGEAFVRFDLPRSGAIRSATLTGELTGGSGSFDFSRIEDDAWTDRTLTWETRPTVVAAPFVTLAPALATRFAIDVTALALTEQLGDGALGVQVRASPGAAGGRFGSRDFARSSFRLELEVDALPGLQSGDIVLLEPGPDVYAVTPGSDLRRLIARVARFAERPRSIAIDPRDGSWVVYDPCDDEGPLFRVDPATGSPSRVSVESDAPCVESPHAVAVGEGGEIYFTRHGSGGGELMRLDPAANGVPIVLATGFDGCVAVESAASLVACEAGGIARVDRATGVRTTLSSGGFLYVPQRVAVGGDAIWVTQPYGPERIVRIDRVTGAQRLVEAPLPGAADDLAVLDDGTLLVATFDRFIIGDPWDRRLELGIVDPGDASYRSIAVKPNTSRVGLARRTDGSVVAVFDDERTGSYLSVIDPSEGSERVVAAPLARDVVIVPDVIVDAKRRLVVVQEDRVVRIDLARQSQETLAAGRPRRARTTLWALNGGSVFADRDGSLLTTEPFAPPLAGTRIRALDDDGTWRTVVETPVAFQSAIVEDPEHFLACDTDVEHDVRLWRIRRSDGAATELPVDPMLGGLEDLLQDPSGALYVIDSHGRGIGTLDTATGAFEMLAPSEAHRMARASSGLYYLRSFIGVVEFDPETAFARVFVDYPGLAAFGAIASVLPRCADGFDNDADGAIDFPADASCASAEQDREGPWACGLGAEIAPLLVGFVALAPRARGQRVRMSRT